MNEQEKKLYEQGNPFLDYNHIKVVSASPDRAEMAVELVPESHNLYGFMHGGLIYTLLDLAGISWNGFPESESLLRSSYRPRPRFTHEGDQPYVPRSSREGFR